jgi:hypothetical protein
MQLDPLIKKIWRFAIKIWKILSQDIFNRQKDVQQVKPHSENQWYWVHSLALGIFSQEVVSDINVFDSTMLIRIVSNLNGSLIVTKERDMVQSVTIVL